MKAIEFEAHISGHSIQIPPQYPVIDKAKVKVILFYEKEITPHTKGNYNKEALLHSLNKAKQKGVFRTIDNPVEWQKKIRDEWE